MPTGYNHGGEGGIHKPRMFVMTTDDNISFTGGLFNVAGVSDKAVSFWEQNKSVSRMDTIQKMADFFGIQKSDIIEPFNVTTHIKRT